MRTVLDEGSILGTIGGLIDDVKNTNSNKDIAKLFAKTTRPSDDSYREFLGGSISKYTKDLTMTFPTLIDNSLSPETASMISKANERNIVSMLQMLFASMQMRATDGREIIQRVYGNKNGLGNMSYDDYIDAFSKYYSDNKGALKFFENSAITEDEMIEYSKKMEAELKRPMKNFPTDSFSDNSLNDYSVLDLNGTEKVKFSPVKEARFDEIDDDVLEILKKRGYDLDDNGFIRQDPHNLGQKLDDFAKNYNDVLAKSYARDNQVSQQALNTRKFVQQQRMDRMQIQQMRNQMRKDQMDTLSRQLMDSDVKKSNEMQPTMMIINFSEVDPADDYRIMDQRSFIAGVKSRLIPVSSSDILERVVAKNKTRINFLNFIRATTGEISFMKDFVLCLKQAKIDAKNSIKRGQAAEMWKTLESLSAKNNRNKLRKSGNDASAITTLVINQETANLISKQYDINIENINTARQIMNDYNLLGIIIADESIEVVKFLYDGQDMFEQQAYSFLEKENNDKSYKKIINLMSQNRRF